MGKDKQRDLPFLGQAHTAYTQSVLALSEARLFFGMQ
ncbi:hypothetical protein M5D96_007916 [Drosophila gunungcola]|uniref:Uncharacterized protein n=1 Tax=Drosophila gunungcola TaxID=103775 RepID=A0A9Q0BPN6_9MUSC|nr:hypothetical protein M5D96_007916 [Drosophila gunungcola]